MKIVLDTNVLISGIFWKGVPYKIIELWANGNLQIVVTKKILKEYFEVLNRIDTSGEIAKKWKLFILEKVLIVAEKTVVKLSRDANDDMFINCALSADVEYLVSGDKDLLTLEAVYKTKILPPAQFLNFFRKSNNRTSYIDL